MLQWKRKANDIAASNNVNIIDELLSPTLPNGSVEPQIGMYHDNNPNICQERTFKINGNEKVSKETYFLLTLCVRDGIIVSLVRM